MYMYIHIHTYMYIYVYICKYIYLCMYIYICIYIHICIYNIRVYTYTYTYIHTHVYNIQYTHIYICIYRYTYLAPRLDFRIDACSELILAPPARRPLVRMASAEHRECDVLKQFDPPRCMDTTSMNQAKYTKDIDIRSRGRLNRFFLI